MSRTSIPAGSIRISTYSELRHHITAFATGLYPFLIIIGTAGLGKSRAIKEAMKDREHLLLENHATAFGLYEACYKHQNQPLILDDLDHLYRDDACIRLLKALCNTELVKSLRWTSTHSLIGDEQGQIPGSFTTTSPVCLLTNQWSTTNEHVRAVEDRAIIIHFAPSADEVHQEVGRWSQNLTVHEFLGEHLGLNRQPSIRHYVRGEQFQKANPEHWQDLLLESMGVNERIRVLVRLSKDVSFKNEEERVEVFEKAGLGSRATYFRWKAEMEKSRCRQLTVAG